MSRALASIFGAVAVCSGCGGDLSLGTGGQISGREPEPASEPEPSWSVRAVRAPEVWARGFRGAGVTVAVMDTGVDLGEPDLLARWRGGPGGWFDASGASEAPYDAIGHGTQTLSIVTRVAPEAQWIAAKIYDDAGRARVEDIHRAFAWLLDPDGDPTTDDAPRIVSASWSIGEAGDCDETFAEDLRALRDAGILIVFAAGNSGPRPSSGVSPACASDALSVGAVDRELELAAFSSRGPSPCGESVFPSLVAPGAGVDALDLSLADEPEHVVVDGTSFAAPHVAGAAALLRAIESSPANIERALVASARDLGAAGADDEYGHGLCDAYGAYLYLMTGGL